MRVKLTATRIYEVKEEHYSKGEGDTLLERVQDLDLPNAGEIILFGDEDGTTEYQIEEVIDEPE